MFADDIVLMAENEDDLQCLIDAVNEWCVNNHMVMNTSKTKVMHLHRPSKVRSDFEFKCGLSTLNLNVVFQVWNIVASISILVCTSMSF